VSTICARQRSIRDALLDAESTRLTLDERWFARIPEIKFADFLRANPDASRVQIAFDPAGVTVCRRLERRDQPGYLDGSDHGEL